MHTPDKPNQQVAAAGSYILLHRWQHDASGFGLSWWVALPPTFRPKPAKGCRLQAPSASRPTTQRTPVAKILEVKYENQADARVCEVAYESQADLCWHEVAYATQATGDASWFFVNYENQASFKIIQGQAREPGGPQGLQGGPCRPSGLAHPGACAQGKLA